MRAASVVPHGFSAVISRTPVFIWRENRPMAPAAPAVLIAERSVIQSVKILFVNQRLRGCRVHYIGYFGIVVVRVVCFHGEIIGLVGLKSGNSECLGLARLGHVRFIFGLIRVLPIGIAFKISFVGVSNIVVELRGKRVTV
ncbi:MAG: hypothetical protein UX53_C0044G0009 [Candidatus Azambacteria bacterium GW2011_GWB2_46_37]|uniref:Uncharacterized protein n=1 Tax=Candidatus Azambacteria bacterium GW2011_GWB2_46_37 TaxID=1618618 RepID=A0A0G1PY26_9BACT|nr:MAG: hypothetical protein UX53_C0044G0009 [Candidatus Azambacteria bacterium GW2011_GWB2_46_37]